MNGIAAKAKKESITARIGKIFTNSLSKQRIVGFFQMKLPISRIKNQ